MGRAFVSQVEFRHICRQDGPGLWGQGRLTVQYTVVLGIVSHIRSLWLVNLHERVLAYLGLGYVLLVPFEARVSLGR